MDGSSSSSPIKYALDESQIPHAWYNAIGELPFNLSPPVHPATHCPLLPADLAAIFPPSIIAQEMSRETWIEIPTPVRDAYRLWRPTPLKRARRLEAALGTCCRIYYKDESTSPIGSHKVNTSLAQAYYNKLDGFERLITETGAGQWGSALSFACQYFGLGCRVYMVRVSFEQKPFRRTLMRIWGAQVEASPSIYTQSGRAILERDPDCPGSLGIAISEAVEDALADPRANYALGSVLHHVMLHQTVIGLEARAQLELAEDQADVVIGCVGGGSNFGGLAFPFLTEQQRRGDLRIIGVEPTACPTLTRGRFTYDFGDTAGLTPLLKMHTLGHGFIPPGIHAGGLRYHGCSPLVSALVDHGRVEAMAIAQTEIFEAATLFARCEAIVPAPETAHAVAATIRVARAATREQAIVFNLSGHGFLDLASYEKYLNGELVDFEQPVQAIEDALRDVPVVEDVSV